MHPGKDIYKVLQKHLDKMPVGYPATRSGVEIRILKYLFSPGQALAASALTYTFEPVDTVYRRVENDGIPEDEFAALLDQMAAKGNIFRKTVHEKNLYALVPFVVGMFEFQLKHMTPELYKDATQYFREAFGLEYLSTAVPQMRVIPIEKSITENHRVATYDEIRRIIEKADGKIGVADCICRKGKDLIGEPCRKTDRRSVCLGFKDYFDTYQREGWVREITREQALEILKKSEEDGLVLQATNEQEPQAVCACCGCCCGVLATLRNIPNPADFVAGNFFARIDSGVCVGCGVCVDRCHMEAIRINEKKAEVDPMRCIGCGVCGPSCKPVAISLVRKQRECVPPKTTEDLYETIMNGKSRWAKIKTALKVLRHMNLKEIREVLRN